ncbi:MAG TPA: lytic transglycosylase domain-containing protein [Candidatus Accumulibacter phosphatis]|nr:lytic transglycosylase domain-containing protein [Candidatus Accumulibacter phosphatis]
MATIEWSAPAGIDDGTLDAVRRVESGGNPNAVSPAGAVGAYQFMPKTAAQFGIDPRDERQSRIAAGKYLSQLQDQFGGDRNLALLAYNWGPGNVDAWMRTGKGANGQEMPPQAQQYADRVNRARDMAAAPQPSFLARMGDAAATAISGTAQAAESPRRAPTITWDDAPGASQPAPTSLRDRSTLKINPTAAIGIDTTFDTGVPLSGGVNDKLSRIGKGMMDVGQGLNQLWLMGTGRPGEAQAYTDQVRAENDRYEASRKLDTGSQNPGVDWMRIGGNIAATSPAILIPGGNSATLGTRALSGGVGGALAGASMFSDQATPAAKTGQAAIGGLLGSAAPVALSKMVDIGSGLLNKGNVVTTRAGQVLSGASSPAQVNLTIQQTLGARGIDFSRLSAEAQAALSDDVRATLRAGAAVSADDIERKAAMLAFDLRPTAAQVTRDPKRWAFERNTADIEGAGDRLKARFVQQNQQLYGAAEKIKGATGGVSPDAHEASGTALSSLLKMDAGKRAAVDSAYDAARNEAGRYVALDHVAFVKQANDALDAGMLGHYLPEQVKNILNDVATGKTPLNVNVAAQIDTVLSAAQRGAMPAEQKAIGVVRTALADAPAADAMGDAARAAFDSARGMARQRFAQIENTPSLKAALDGAAPDQFFGKFVLRGNASDLQALKQSLSSDPQAWNNLRGQTVEWLTDRATLGKGADGVFSGAQLRKAMATLGDQRMRVLFSPEEFANLKTLSKAASAATETPAFTRAGVGSNTAEKLSNLLSKGANLPYLRELVVKPLQSTARDIQVSSSLAGRTPAPSVPPLVGEDAKNALASRLGRSSVPLSVLVQGLAH